MTPAPATALSLDAPARKSLDPDTGLARLEFPRGSGMPNGDYWLVGGICWPLRFEGRMEGHALVAARHVQSAVTFIPLETEFAVIDPLRRPGGGLEPFPALAPWLAQAWAEWFCAAFYRFEQAGGAHDYVAQVRRSPMAQPQPSLPEARFSDPEQAMPRLHQLDGSDRLIYRSESPLVTAMDAYEASTTRPEFSSAPAARPEFRPPLLALLAALDGLSRRPDAAQIRARRAQE